MIDLLSDIRSNRRDDRDRVFVTDMKTTDVPDVMRLEKRCFTLPWSSSAYLTEIGNTNAHYLVAKLENGALIGYGGVWVVMDEMHITTLAVDPFMRGRRIGERMLIRLLQEGMKRGAVRATLEVRQKNDPAHNLYLKYGFKDVAIRRAYYSDNGENAVIMWAEDVVNIANTTMLRINLRKLESLHGETNER